MRYTITLLFFVVILFAACTKSKMCNKKASRELRQLNEAEMIYHEENIDSITYIHVTKYFTPNRDGINDKLVIYASDITTYHIEISNDCKMLYSTSNSNSYWDGTYSGEQMPEGDYDVKIEAEYGNGQKTTINTEISLLR